jgi:hypothetical protein
LSLDNKGKTCTEGIGNMMLRRIFGQKGDEIIGDWKKLHSEELHNFYSSRNIVRRIKSSRMK